MLMLFGSAWQAVIFVVACRHLYFPPEQHPIVCQLGGSNPEKLAAAARVAAGYGYDEINLNCGCPSDRVAGAGCFGASLMLQPEAVGDGCRAMEEATGTEVTVKCRLGTVPPVLSCAIDHEAWGTG